MSTEPVRRLSGLTTALVEVPDSAAVQVFAKATPLPSSAAADLKQGPLMRAVKNTSDTVTVYVAETAAAIEASTDDGWPIGPGETFTFAGSGGFWAGDLYAIAGTGGADLAKLEF